MTNSSSKQVDMHISLQTKASYGVGALGKDFAVSIIYIYLMVYYTDTVGLSAAFAGTLFLFARIIDAVTDPMMGMIVDNTRSRFGKFRPWILIGTLVNSALLIAVFSTHLLEGAWLYAYAAATYILWGITYTIMDIPFWSIFPALSAKRSEREKLVIWPRLFAAFAWMLMGTYGLFVIDSLGGDDRGQGFIWLTVIITLFFIVSSLIMVINVKEKVAVKTEVEKFGLKDVVHILARNDQLKALFGSVLFFNLAIHLIGTVGIYYFTYAIGQEDLFPIFMAASGAAEITGILLFPHLCNILPRRLMWFFACGFPIACSIILTLAVLFSPENILLVGAAGACLKFGFGLANVQATVMLADVVDYGEHKTGKRSESIIFSVQTLLVKAAGALAGFFGGVGLSLIGYQPNVAQTEDTIWGMRILMMGLPFVLMFFSAWIYHKWYHLHDGFRPDIEFISGVGNVTK